MTGYILVVDDDKDICNLLCTLLVREGYETAQAHDGRTALKLLAQREPDVMLLDCIIPEPNGMTIIALMRDRYPELPIIMITAYAGVAGAVCAIKAGAWEYLPKPFDNLNVIELVNKAVKLRSARRDTGNPALTSHKERVLDAMGYSRQMEALAGEIVMVAETDFSVVIQGETGAGKGVVAKLIHDSSPRIKGPLVAVDCGAMSDTLIENELFGHEKGSYTGAHQTGIGKFESSAGGTLFLDEIANMSLLAQPRLLRALQDRVITRVGGNQEIKIDARIISASHANLIDSVVDGAFREDLYYRLNEYALHITALRDRRDDILYLAKKFLRSASKELGHDMPALSPAAENILYHADWPGNARELRSVMRRSCLVSQGKTIQAEHLAFCGRKSVACSRGTPADAMKHAETNLLQGCDSLKKVVQIRVDSIEQEIIADMMRNNGNNKAKVARLLKMDYKTLSNKLKKITGGDRSNEKDKQC
jgi:two-component system, NtrC family, response regulator HydG